jgi:long-chain acyl-CoA synthetase
MSLNLATLVAENARRYPEAAALVTAETVWSYREFECEVRGVAAQLHACGVRPGDRVGLMVPNRPEFSIHYYAILHTGAVVVPINILFVADEVANLLADSEAVACIVWAGLDAGRAGAERVASCHTRLLASAPVGEHRSSPISHASSPAPAGWQRLESPAAGAAADLPRAQTMPDDTAVLLYTSGTTGKPKGAELTHFNLYENARFVSERQFSRWPQAVTVLGPGHVALAALPLSHSFGQTAMQNGLLFGGGAIRYLERFDPWAALQAMQQGRVTLFAGVPTMYFALLGVPDAEHRFDLSSLRFCVSGGAALPVEVKRQFEARFRVHIQEAYGLSETSPLACSQEVDRTEKAGSIGRPIWGCDMCVADDQGQMLPTGQPGEVLIRGSNILKGYYRRPEATAETMRGGWFHSGDIGYVDADGDYYIVDRKKDMIIRGGFNVYPREVEEILYRHPAVREAAVVGVPDLKYGEEIKAVVALHPGSAVAAEDLIEFCKAHMASYKYPRIVQIVAALPKGPTGKILKRELRG